MQNETFRVKGEKKITQRRIKKLFVVDEYGEIKELPGHVSDVKSLTIFIIQKPEVKPESKKPETNPVPKKLQPKKPNAEAQNTPFDEVNRCLQLFITIVPKVNKRICKQLPIIHLY